MKSKYKTVEYVGNRQFTKYYDNEDSMYRNSTIGFGASITFYKLVSGKFKAFRSIKKRVL